MKDHNIMKKALFICSRPIYPIIGGDQIRFEQQLKLLSERFDVDVIYLTSNRREYNNEILYPENVNIKWFYISKFKHLCLALRFLLNSKPIQVNYYYSKKVQAYIDSIICEYDIVLGISIRTCEYIKKYDCVFKYLDFVDCVSMNYYKAKSAGNLIKKIIYKIEHSRCKKYEKNVIKYFDSCAFISDIDKNYIFR